MKNSESIPLYDVPRNSKIRIALDNPEGIRTPVASKRAIPGDILTFYNIDGMYSKCIDTDGDYVYLAGWTRVHII